MTRALVVANNGPEIYNGGGQRTLLLIKMLQAKGFKVDLVVLIRKEWGFYGEDSPIITEWKQKHNLVKYFQPSFRSPYLPDYSVFRWLSKNQMKYQYLLFRYDITAFKSAFYFLNKRKIIVDCDDFLLGEKRGISKIKYWLLYLVLRNSLKQSWILNDHHFKYFKETGVWVPNLPLSMFNTTMKKFHKERTTRPSLMFVGSYLNEFLDFLEAVSTDLLQEIPDVKIFIVSRAIKQADVEKYPQENFEWLNNVVDITDVYKLAWISIAPGFKREGTHIKIIESIYHDTPVVCTKDSLRGYEYFNEMEELIPASNDHTAFVNNIKRLLSNKDDLQQRSEKLKRLCHSKFSFNNLVGTLVL